MLSVAQGTSVFGRVLFGALADRLRAPRKVLAGLGLLSGLAGTTLAIAGHALSISALLALLAVYGAAAIGWNGVFLAEVARLAPSGKAAVATSGVLFFTYLGVVLGPPTFGAIAQLGGSFSYAFAAAATVASLCALRLLTTTQRSRTA